jgi:hypothetical protein
MSTGITTRALTLATVALAAVPWLPAQAPHDMEPGDKIELFLQHLGKVVQVEPRLYESFLLEYELAQSIAELGTAHPDPLLGDFILRGLRKLHPELDRALTELAAGDRDAASRRLEALAGDRDPFLSACCRLRLAEIALAAGDHAAAAAAAERVVRHDRPYLLDDHRACEVIALCFEAGKKPILEYLQWAILLTDFHDLPPALEARAKERLAALETEAGRPVEVVADWMHTVEKWIRDLDTGVDPTQRTQGQILVALDKMIELQEARERNACRNCGALG